MLTRRAFCVGLLALILMESRGHKSSADELKPLTLHVKGMV